MAKLPDVDEWAREAGKKGAQYALELLEQEYGVLAARLRELAQADQEGRCVVLPEGGYEDKDGANALKSAMHPCFYHNNPVTRFISDAVAEKLTRQGAQAELRRAPD